MADLKDTYVVHCAEIRCTKGMRESYLVLENTHGVYLKQMPALTVKDCVADTNLINFGGCYSIENPSTQEEAKKIKEMVEDACPDTFTDKFGKCFCRGDKEDIQLTNEGEFKVVGECLLALCAGQEWNYGKEKVTIDGEKPLMGGAKLYCIYGGEIEIITSGQPEE